MVVVVVGIRNVRNALLESLPRFIAHAFDLVAAASWAHGTCVVGVVFLVFDFDVGTVAWDDDGAA